jgi:uncharacterized OsmC-like protein
MRSDDLRALQAPLKQTYRERPEAARVTLRAHGRLSDQVTCRVDTWRGATTDAGLHPATGGTGEYACSGDMLLQALVACAGVTLAAVATAMNVALANATVDAEGDLDFRGTLGVAKEVPVGFQRITLRFTLDTDAPPEQQARLIATTERYCVVYQTLRHTPEITVSVDRLT